MLEPTAGDKLGPYNLVRRLATGGMAELFLAEPEEPAHAEQRVVLKRIRPEFADNEQHRQMFIDEARLCDKLEHPHIVRALDISAVEEEHFFAMELVAGVNLRRVLVTALRLRGELPLEIGLSVVLRIASGLHYAHERTGPDGEPLGIVHRDVSMGNVLLGFDGSVKLADFGVAKYTGQENKTGQRILKGKVGYMSPEQCLAHPLDRRSDVFALGIILYEITTGKKLFSGKSDLEVLLKIVHGVVPPPSTYRFDYPPALEAIVLRALALNRDDRYSTAQEFAADLARFCEDAQLPIADAELARYLRDLFPDEANATQDSCDGIALSKQQYRWDDSRDCGGATSTDNPEPIIVEHADPSAVPPEDTEAAAEGGGVIPVLPVRVAPEKRFVRQLAQGTQPPTALGRDGQPRFWLQGQFRGFAPAPEVPAPTWPRDPDALFREANRRLALRLYESARAAFCAVLELRPADRTARAGSYVASACIAMSEGRSAAATQYLAYARSILPHAPDSTPELSAAWLAAVCDAAPEGAAETSTVDEGWREAA